MKRINITLPDELHELGIKHSKELFGTINFSGLVSYLIQSGSIKLSEGLSIMKESDESKAITELKDILDNPKVEKLKKRITEDINILGEAKVGEEEKKECIEKPLTKWEKLARYKKNNGIKE